MIDLVNPELEYNSFIKDLFNEIRKIIQNRGVNNPDIKFNSVKILTLMGIPVKNFNANEWRNSIALKSRSRIFKKELKMFLNILENYEKHGLFTKMGIISYDENGIPKTLGLKELENLFLEKAVNEYESAYLNYIERQITKDKDYQRGGISFPYDETYLQTGSEYHYRPESYTASPDEQIINSDLTQVLDINASSEFVPSDPIIGLIDRLKMESSYYKIGLILAKLYNEVRNAEIISTTTAMGYSMRLSAILVFISKNSYNNIAAYMFNNYNWAEDVLPLKPDALIDRIKDLFRTAIYSKNPQNRNYSPDQYPAEFTDTAGLKNESADYGTAYAMRSEQRLSTGNFLDDIIAYLLSSNDYEYQEIGRQLGTIQNYIIEKVIIDNLEGLRIIDQMIEMACEGMTTQMAKDISANTIADNASFDRQEIIAGIKKGFYKLLKNNRPQINNQGTSYIFNTGQIESNNQDPTQEIFGK